MLSVQKYKACLIIPYFGTLPNYFDVFLRTCRANWDFDWLIITDDRTVHPYPTNVHLLYMSFKQFVDRVQANFDFLIALNQPYKICDFRAAFGEIFSKELKEYRFWGHCDLDQYFGKIGNFITDDILDIYDKILCLGHFTLFRNTPYMNALYRTEDKAYQQGYRDAFSDTRHWIFDEWPQKNTSINKIMKQEHVHTYLSSDCFCDLLPFRSYFRRTLFDPIKETWTQDKVKNEVYYWECGVLLRCWRSGNKIVKREILYVHIRQRHIYTSEYSEELPALIIVPNRIVSISEYDEDAVRRVLHKTKLRGFLFPDECRRGFVLMRGFARAAFRRFKSMVCKA